MRYPKPSIHSVSACEPRPSAASIAALYPRIPCSLDMSRSARKPATASAKRPTPTQMSARCFAQVNCSSRLFMVRGAYAANAKRRHLPKHELAFIGETLARRTTPQLFNQQDVGGSSSKHH
jgi:hypothetical protein